MIVANEPGQALSYSQALHIVHYVADANQPDADDIDDLDDDVLEVVARQEEALEAIETLLAYFSVDIDTIPAPAIVDRDPPSLQAEIESVEGIDEADDGEDIDFSDPFFAIQLALLMATCTVRTDDDLVVMDAETASIARSAIRMVEHLLTHHRGEIASIAAMSRMSRTIN